MEAERSINTYKSRGRLRRGVTDTVKVWGTPNWDGKKIRNYYTERERERERERESLDNRQLSKCYMYMYMYMYMYNIAGRIETMRTHTSKCPSSFLFFLLHVHAILFPQISTCIYMYRSIPQIRPAFLHASIRHNRGRGLCVGLWYFCVTTITDQQSPCGHMISVLYWLFDGEKWQSKFWYDI